MPPHTHASDAHTHSQAGRGMRREVRGVRREGEREAILKKVMSQQESTYALQIHAAADPCIGCPHTFTGRQGDEA